MPLPDISDPTASRPPRFRIKPLRDYRSAIRPGKSNTGSDPALVKLNLELARSLSSTRSALARRKGSANPSRQPSAEGVRTPGARLCRPSVRIFVPQLGDGRANLLGEVMGVTALHYDIQLKGSGRLPSPAVATQSRGSFRSCASTS